MVQPPLEEVHLDSPAVDVESSKAKPGPAAAAVLFPQIGMLAAVASEQCSVPADLSEDPQQEQPGTGVTSSDALLVQRNFKFEMHNRQIPSCVIAPEAASVVTAYMDDDMTQDGYEIKHLKCMGPATAWGLVFNFVTWSTFLCAPLLGKCSGWVSLMAYLVYVALALLLKFFAFRYTFPCFLAINGDLNNFSIFKMPLNFTRYAFVMGFISICSSLDVVTNTIFVNSASILHGGKVYLVWGLMLLQPLYVLAYTFVVSSQEDFKTAVQSGMNNLFPFNFRVAVQGIQTAVWQTLFETDQTHVGAILACAHGGRMKTVTLHMMAYLERFHSTRRCGNAAFKFMRQLFSHAVVFLFVDSVALLSLKAEVMTDSCARGSCNPIAVLGTILGLVMGALDLVQSVISMWALFNDVVKGHKKWLFLTTQEQNQAHHNRYWKESDVIINAAQLLVVHSFVAGFCIAGLLIACAALLQRLLSTL